MFKSASQLPALQTNYLFASSLRSSGENNGLMVKCVFLTTQLCRNSMKVKHTIANFYCLLTSHKKCAFGRFANHVDLELVCRTNYHCDKSGQFFDLFCFILQGVVERFVTGLSRKNGTTI